MVWLLLIAVVGGGGGGLWQTAAFGLFLPIGILFGVGRWWRMRYWLEGSELRVSQGFLLRREVFLPRERVQAIDVSAGVLHRLMGVVRVQVKSGAAGTQIDLSAVTRGEAERLIAALRPADAEDAPGRVVADGRTVSRASGATSRTWTVTPPRLLLLGVVSKRLGILLGGIMYVLGQVLQSEPNPEEEVGQIAAWGELASQWLAGSAPIVLAVVAVLVLTTSWGLSIVDTLVRWGRFDVQRTTDRITVRRGLLEERRTSLSADRLQAIRVVEGPVFLQLGYAAVYVESVGHQEEQGVSTCLHPILKRTSLRPFLAEIAPELLPGLDADLLRPPRRAAIRFFGKPIAATLVLAGAATVADVRAAWLFGLLLPVCWVAARSLQETGMAVGTPVGRMVSRGVQRVTVLFPRRRVQTADVVAGPFQRRRGLATASVVVASGALGRTFAARDLSEEDAGRLLDWLERSGEARLRREVADSDEERVTDRHAPILRSGLQGDADRPDPVAADLSGGEPKNDLVSHSEADLRDDRQPRFSDSLEHRSGEAFVKPQVRHGHGRAVDVTRGREDGSDALDETRDRGPAE